MAKVFHLKAGEKRRVLWLFSSSIPGEVRFRAEAADGSMPQGTVELARRRWFEWQRSAHPLAARNVFDKGIADADYRIYVTPETDCRIEFDTRHFRAEIYFRVLAGVIGLGILGALGAFILAPPA
ncbi:MAG: hypothetical protein AAF666_07375 [Pseudomonadota bacterium]